MRSLGAVLTLLLLTAPVFAQQADEPFFRFGFGQNVEGVVTPPDDPEPNDDGSLSYPAATPDFGESVQVPPSLSQGLTAYGYTWYDTGPEYAVLDEVTGVVTWNAQFRGTMSANVYAYTDPDQNSGIIGVSSITVPTTYTINVTPPAYNVQYGAMGLSQNFTATTSPSQPSAGEEWNVEYETGGDYMYPLDQIGNIVYFDSTERLESEEMWPGDYRWRFTRTADGEKTYGPWVDFDVSGWPYFDYSNATTASYKLKHYDSEEEGVIVQVKVGTPISIPAVARRGAHQVPSSAPAWVYSTPERFPPGLSVLSNGTLTGTATGPAGKRYDNVRVPVVDNSGTVYGWSYYNIVIVENFIPDDDVFDIPDENNPEPPVDPEDPDDPEDPGTPTVYVVAEPNFPESLPTTFNYDGVRASGNAFNNYGYKVLLQTEDYTEATEFYEEIAAQHLPTPVRLIQTENTALPYNQWYQTDIQDGFLPFTWGYGRNSNGTPSSSCTPHHYVYIASFATFDHAYDYQEWQRSFGGFSGAVQIFQGTYGGGSEVVACDTP